ncbi:DNA replication inhibitor plutonium isoform X2 [Phlebotomus papatasi]|uniref:DNA replication inhibitor plutonium isoform X2 n=1 Tax=Phlebotomus papatasi TaxID=29031 RepID=UPI002484567F|nr:DNA replication inhibitor plutonium isoform X2 [Phlebotomus papatasi]
MSAEIFKCILRDDHSMLQHLLTNSHIWVDIMDENGNTPLMMACRMGFVKCVRRLISNGADVLHVNRIGINALTLASLSGSIEIMDILLKVSPIEQFIQRTIISPLSAAIFAGHLEAVQYLLQLHKPLYDTITREGKDFQLIDNLLAASSLKGNSPLMLSIMFERPEIARLFWNEPAHFKNDLGMTALDILEYRAKFMEH